MRTGIERADFRNFPARAYLEKYYDRVGPENAAMLLAITEYLSTKRPGTGTVIEVAGGPSLFPLMALSAHRRRPFARITFTDIAMSNLAEVAAWIAGRRDQFDYTALLGWLEELTGAPRCSIAQCLRDSQWDMVQFDWQARARTEWRGAFDVVCSHFFAESATSEEDRFVRLLGRLGELGRSGGVVLLSFICNSVGYTVADIEFPAFPVSEHNLPEYFERAGLSLKETVVHTVPADDHGEYDSLVFVAGQVA